MDHGWPRGRSRHGGIDEVPVPAPGRLWLAGKRYIAPDPEAALAAVGASGLVCLCEKAELAERYPAYVAWLQASSPDLARWWPVPDLHAPDAATTLSIVAWIGAALDSGAGVVVHCGAGFGRAGTIAAAVLVSYGSSRDQALDAVARARPGAGPEVGAQADLLLALTGPKCP